MACSEQEVPDLRQRRALPTHPAENAKEDDQAPTPPAAGPKPLSAREAARRNRGRPMNKLIHSKVQESRLSVVAQGTDYRGFFNLFGMVLVAANLRLVVENLMKYGILLEPPTSFFDFYKNWPCAVCYTVMVCCVLGIWIVERYCAKVLGTDLRINICHVTIVVMMFVMPIGFIYGSNATQMNALVLVVFSICWCMKMISFAHTCYDIRHAKARGVVDRLLASDETSRRIIIEKGFPDCLTFQYMAFYLAVPTLCFQLHYPRMRRIRKLRLARHFGAAVVSTVFGYILVEQYISPTLTNARSAVHMEVATGGGPPQLRLSHLVLLERLLKLSLPNLYLWLIMFYGLFHSWCNILGELTLFGDRCFYEDWWNAASFAEYWKRWNLPVHHWFLRHMYFPLVRRGYSQLFAGFAVFLVSGLLHEFLVVVPLRLTRPTVLVTLAFVCQLPLVTLTAHPILERQHRTLGNMIFWFAFCFSGQPVAVIVYFFLAADEELVTFGSLLSLR